MPRSTVTYKLHEIEALILRDIEARGLRAISPVRFYATWAHTIRAEVDSEPPPPEEPETRGWDIYSERLDHPPEG